MATETNVIRMQFVEKGASGVTNGVKKMGGAAKKTDSNFTSLNKTLLRFGGLIALIGAFKKATTAALDFGTAMAEVKTLLDDTSQFDRLRQSVKSLSLEFGQAPVEQAKALYQVVSAGAQDAAVAIDILRVANELSIAGITDVAVAADALTTVMNAYGDSVGTAKDVSDSFFVAVKAGKTTIPELAGNIGQVSGVGATLGVTLEEILAATAALTKGTLNTTRSLRGLRAVMTAIVKPTEEALEVAELLAIDFSAAGLAAQGFTEFLNGVQVAAKGDAAILSKLFGNVEGLIPILALGGAAAEDYASSLALMEAKAGATAGALEIMADDAKFKVNRAFVALTIKAEELGNVFLVVLAPAAELVADNIDLVALSVVALTTALAVFNISAIVTGLKAFLVVIKAIGVALLATPVGWVVTGLTAIAAAVVILNRKFMIWESVLGILKIEFKVFVNTIKILFNNLLNFMDGFFSKIDTKVYDFRISIQEGLVFLASKIGTQEGFENATKELERLQNGQMNYNSTIEQTILDREAVNKLLTEETNLLLENEKILLKQLTTRRDTQTLGTDDPNAPPLPGSPEINKELAEQEIRMKKLLELQARGLELVKELRTPNEIYIEQMKELNELYKADAVSLETFNRAQKKYQEELKASSEQTEEFGNLIEKAIDGTLTAKDIFLIGVKQILRGLLEMNKEAQRTSDSFLQLGNSLGGGGGLGGSIGGIVGSLFGSFFSPTPTAIPSPPVSASPVFTGLLAAKGAVVHRGIQTFDKGEIFNTATTFPMANGRGLMSEGGPEAVMPLERGSGGRLGVRASGSSSKVVINIVDQRSGGEKAQVKERVDSQGNRQIDVLITDSVNRSFANGNFDKSMKLFGSVRGGNRR